MASVGKPAKYKTPEEMESAIEDYFTLCKLGEEFKWVDKKGMYHCETLPIPPSTESLSLHLGFVNRSSLLDYETRHKDSQERYSSIIKRAKSKIAARKLALAEMGQLNDRVVMFDLAVNHGYIQEININVNETHQLSDQDRALLGNMLKQIPGQLQSLPQVVIDVEAEEIQDINGSETEES
jgi:hypothetical protein